MKISAKTKVCIIIGDPVEHSLSPAMHNAGYEELNIDDQFVFLGATVKPENLEDTVKGVRAMGIRGLTCTIPHKIEVMKYLDEVDVTAKQIGAVNTVVNESGKLKGYNTDWLGVVNPLEKQISLSKKKVALIGAGGAAHAMAYGVLKKGATLTIFNRTVEKAEELAQVMSKLNYKVEVKSTQEISIVQNYDIILNSTSLGMGEQLNETPVPKEYITKDQIIFDAVYVPYETKLLKDAKEKGATIIHGLEMLLHQALIQFELYTNHKAPEKTMRKVLQDNLAI
jgi:shikimate dehydrogenase